MPSKQREVVDALLAARNGAVAIAQHNSRGPILPIYSINFTNLPNQIAEPTKTLMIELNGSAGPYDRGNKSSRNDDTIGAMRQIHANEPHYLPVLDTSSLSGRGKAYNAYVTANKGHTNDRGGANDTTGYIEYTAGDNQVYPHAHLSEMRIVFDYVNGRVFLTPFHYQSWTMVGNDDLIVVDKPQLGSGHDNPFFWIIEIRKRVT